ncbi:hypothetical protein ACFST9_02770 [Hymenobacter monticola]|uniref:VCBS repeat-containing protein n=1 Tax=Hymenobacter monticola TaxID=1705399 RepID=A0ABY4B1W2_9BACT|nr:hypothetical protein [Hymenobacter monticola]UOE33117.1 hypothetical protein MTP16_18560 [Hymenobacter monticola]
MQTRLLFALTFLGWFPAAAGRAQPVSGTAAATFSQQYAAENALVRKGSVLRMPGETDVAFLKRLFPGSFSVESLVAYAWRPGAHGRQLLFSRREVDQYQQEGEGTELFVLDPFQPNTYAVQKLLLAPIGDITNLSALFFADVDEDGQKELLALVYAEVQEAGTLEHGDGTTEQAYARMSRRHTYVFRYAGLSRAGRPWYRADATPRPYLQGLPTAAAVRQALVRHQARGTHRK